MTISTRYTQQLMVGRSLDSLQAGLGRLAKTQEHLHTGKLINRPSDSPTGANTSMRLRAETTAQNQYARNAQDGLGWLGQIDSTLTSMLDGVRRARELALQGASANNSSPETRAALAAEVEQLREGLLGQANATHLGRPVFGGITAGTQAYDRTSGAFVGETTGSVERTVADGVRVRVDLSGPEVFGTGADDLFRVLDELATHLRSDPASISGDLDRLDASLSRMQTSLGDVGTRYGRVEQAALKAKDAVLNLQASLSEVEDVDLPKAMVDLNLQEVAYQASLATTARVLQPSLIDFLR